MLERALEMRKVISAWLALDLNKTRYQKLIMKEEEWKYVEVLLNVLEPYWDMTNACGASLAPTAHEIFRCYNFLFDKLDHQQKQCTKYKQRSAKCKDGQQLLGAIEAAKDKLSKYYSKTDGSAGHYCAMAVILNPAVKLTDFQVCQSKPYCSLFKGSY
jgi:hypothetical protein